MADQHVHPIFDPLGHPGLSVVKGESVGLYHRALEAVAFWDVRLPTGNVPGPRVGIVEKGPEARLLLPGQQVDEGLPLEVEPLYAEGWHLGQEVTRHGIKGCFAAGAAIKVGEEGLQVDGHELLGDLRRGFGNGMPQGSG